jgi:hypothetical protein
MRFWSLNTFRSVFFHGILFHPYIGCLATVFIASSLRLTPLSSKSSCLRQPIPWLSHGHLLLRQSHSRASLRLTPTPALAKEPAGELSRS